MKSHLIVLGLAPALALAACGGGGDNLTSSPNSSDNMTEPMMAPDNQANAMMTGEAASPGQAFADTAAASDFYEISAGRMAQEKATDPKLKEFGAMMVEHHSASTEKLKAAGAKANPAITPNPVLNAEQEANLAALEAATGADFDAKYKAQQIVAHEKALAAMTGYAGTGDVPELKAFAGETSKVVETHLTKIKGL